MAETQSTDPQIQVLQSSPEAIPLANLSHPLYCDTSTGTQCPLIPKAWRQVIPLITHPGIQVSQKLVTARYIWPSINSDVRHWTRSCVQCQCAKIQRHIRSLLLSFPAPKACFQIVHVDLVGPLQSSRGFSYLLTCIDHFTRWPEAIPITNTTTEAVIQVFLNKWVSRFSVPSTIATNHGRQFEYHQWTNLMSFLLKVWSLAELCQTTL